MPCNEKHMLKMLFIFFHLHMSLIESINKNTPILRRFSKTACRYDSPLELINIPIDYSFLVLLNEKNILANKIQTENTAIHNYKALCY